MLGLRQSIREELELADTMLGIERSSVVQPMSFDDDFRVSIAEPHERRRGKRNATWAPDSQMQFAVSP